ncbi:MAG: ATP-binding cassette domain-containing protein [Candidatus Neomarinimicrobiota bacterium]|jgi:ABC-type oligopeptide transport system ATPase subunit|nr:ATP-binding cassette domain-containing protein [Candidatus Neomarinimicrobiota bacterium]
MKLSKSPLLSVKNLVKYFPIRRGIFSRVKGFVKAVDDISFDIPNGKTLGLVGESGCGKTTAGRTILRLIDPTSGTIKFEGNDITKLTQKNLRPLRKKFQIIFQDPYSSLNPRMTVRSILAEALLYHSIVEKTLVDREIFRLLDVVGLQKFHADRYPHEFSGGQRQRIGIARALSVKPKMIVCDEATSALDVSVQAQIINLLKDLQTEFKLTYLFISHDLSLVEYISDKIAVMYNGKIVEMGDSTNIYNHPKHAYTKKLVTSLPNKIFDYL